MKITTEKSLRSFEFWGEALATVKYLTDEELDTIEEILEELNPEGLSETEINDTFWFGDDEIAYWLGYDSFEEIMERGEQR